MNVVQPVMLLDAVQGSFASEAPMRKAGSPMTDPARFAGGDRSSVAEVAKRN
jgi:hypothetical protein